MPFFHLGKRGPRLPALEADRQAKHRLEALEPIPLTGWKRWKVRSHQVRHVSLIAFAAFSENLWPIRPHIQIASLFDVA